MSKSVMTASVSVQFAAYENQHSGMWVGECKELGIVVEADDLNDLHNMVDEAIGLLLMDVQADGELDAFLQDHGWTGEPDWRSAQTATYAQQQGPPSSCDWKNSIPWNLVARGVSHVSEAEAT